MSFQDIVISPDVIDKMINEYDNIDLNSYWKNLKYKRIVFEKINGIIVEKIREHLKNADKLIKLRIETEILDSIRFSNKSKIIDLKRESKFTKNKINNLLLNLVLKTDSKLLNVEDSNINSIIKPFHDELKSIEILNLIESISPPSNSRILNAQRTIELYHKEEFKIHEILKYYFINTESLIICDKYVIHKKGGYKILFDILSNCQNLKTLEIWTKFDHKNKEDFVTKEELINDLNNYIKRKKYQIKYIICAALGNQHRRHIYTDYFDIKMDVGLNFLDSEYKVNKSDTDIIINEKDKKLSESIIKIKENIERYNQILYQSDS